MLQHKTKIHNTKYTVQGRANNNKLTVTNERQLKYEEVLGSNP